MLLEILDLGRKSVPLRAVPPLKAVPTVRFFPLKDRVTAVGGGATEDLP